MDICVYEGVKLKILKTREEMGAIAACDAGEAIRSLLKTQQTLNCVFAAAPSQNEFLAHLIEQPDIDWGRINAFHMDEYIGLAKGSEKSFSGYLNRHIFQQVPFRSVHLIDGLNSTNTECQRYGALLAEHPIDMVFMGIGENGHIAFNDPGVARFRDSEVIKAVELDIKCRQQQVNDQCFDTLQDVPRYALTLTIPTLINCKQIFCIVPSSTKANAVKEALTGVVTESCPASILRTRNHVKMYIDEACATALKGGKKDEVKTQ